MAKRKGARGRGSLFGEISGLRPGRSVFNLSYEKKLTLDMGMLVPVMAEMMVPGDTFIWSNEIVARLGPMLAPVLHEINVFVHCFFVPFRILWPGDEVGPNTWESYITGGPLGTDSSTLPVWTPSTTVLGSLWDYMGFPVGVAGSAGFRPMAFPMNAYNMIYNEYYRDEQQIAKVSLSNDVILYRSWEPDYFTKALPWTQRGTPPALPFSGSAVWQASTFAAGSVSNPIGPSATANDAHLYATNTGASLDNIRQAFNANTLTAATFGVNDLRLSFQIQRILERNARGGIRYPEWLLGHFNEDVGDARLQRPEYIGGTKAPIIMSEVLQTAGTTNGAQTGVGSMLGHGLGVHKGQKMRYHASEYGVLMGILSVMPRAGYSQGINRQWLAYSSQKSAVTRYDFYHPELAHLGEQPVFEGELYLDTSDSDNQTVFGYQERWNHLRYNPNIACGLFGKGQTLNYWHLNREFATAPALNQTFLECKPGKRIFQDQNAGDHAFYLSVGNLIKAIRPLPYESSPGLLDHF